MLLNSLFSIKFDVSLTRNTLRIPENTLFEKPYRNVILTEPGTGLYRNQNPQHSLALDTLPVRKPNATNLAAIGSWRRRNG